MNKGDIVKIKAVVRSVPEYTSNGIVKRIRRYDSPFLWVEKTGIVLGYSFLKTGKIIKGNYYDEPNYLEVSESCKVLVIEPLESYGSYLSKSSKLIESNRYLEPVRCLEEDLEIIKCRDQ